MTDSLNRMTWSPYCVTYGYTNDILGNRTWRSYGASNHATLYAWDDVNRLDRTGKSSAGASYKYRSDGMRIEKVEGLTISYSKQSGFYDENWATNKPTTRYFYDGQMAVEEDYTRDVSGTAQVDVTRYGIGARGIDMIAKDPYNAAETKYYPIYDGHGNNVGLVTRNGTGFTVSNRRAYDAWGIVRQGSTSGEPFQRYCANLGHVQDDESGLTYMRARYYEPWTGRFVCPDSAQHGPNYFIYCTNDPVNRIDESGKSDELLAWMGVLMAIGFLIQKAIDLSIKYLTPWLITMGIVMYVVEGMSHLPTGIKIAAGLGNLAAGALLKGTLDAIAQGLQNFFTQMTMQAPYAAYHMMSRAAASMAVYFIALAVYTLMIGIDA